MSVLMAILLGLMSMVGYGLANVLSQPLAKKLGTAQSLFLRGFSIIVILGIGVAFMPESLTHYREMLIVFGLGVIGYLPLLAFTHGLKVSRISVVAPIAGTSPLVTVLLSFLVLSTQINLLQWLAIVVVIGANIAMSVDPKNLRNSNVMQLSSGVPFALLAALGWGGFYFLLIYATRWLGPWLAAFLVEAGVTLAAGLHVLFSHQRVSLKDAVSRPIVINGALICLGTVAYTIGVRYFNVGIVASLSNSTAVISALVATYMFHEHMTKKEKLAAAVMVTGICAITLF
ncbi:MAG TPA: DMT family transporter [Patescibacteria group bacterium]|nr:DMT family transporter [Patescibacteria group bacterium]